MNRTAKNMWLVALCFYTSGCAVAYQPARIQDEIQEDVSEENLAVVCQGDDVRVTLLSGEEVDGEIAEINDEMLTMKYKHYNDRNRDIRVSEIEKIEIKEKTGEVTTTGAVIIGVVTAGVVVGGLALAEAGRALGN